MRDPQRIKPMLDLLRQIWEANPDLRLGQLIMNTTKPSIYSDGRAEVEQVHEMRLREDDAMYSRLLDTYCRADGFIERHQADGDGEDGGGS